MALENTAEIQAADSSVNEPQLGSVDEISALQNQPIYTWLD